MKVTNATNCNMIVQTAPKRTTQFERSLMIAELELDGIKTHIDLAKNCILKNTPYERKIKKALSEIRSARDKLRNDIGSKQLTITTRAKSIRRPNQTWDCTPKRAYGWTCPFCYPSEKSEK